MLKFNLPKMKVNPSNVLPTTEARLSTFNLSETLTTTIKTDYLYPLYWQELQPNDHFEIKASALARILPMVAPPMSNIKMKFFAFWVPNRLLWNKWINFMGERTFQSDETEGIRVPQISLNHVNNVTGGIMDYLGVPPTATTIDKTVSALPLRAYNKIWNEWFRANYIQEEVKEFSGDTSSEETLEVYKLLKKGKPLDYFTSCLPQPLQVDVSLAGDSPIKLNDVSGSPEVVVSTPGGPATILSTSGSFLNCSGVQSGIRNEKLYADMASVTGLSINSLRKSVAIQELLEKDMRSGYRYIDMVKEHFGVEVPDFLVGRTEYLGSTTTSINAEPIAQTGESSRTPQGNLASVGFGVQDDKLCEISAREHGILMILGCVESEVVYQQGLDRKWEKRDRFDYYWPEFANLGEQPVMEREIFLSADNANSDKVFGYTPRYREYREGYSKVSGLMRSNVTEGFQSLDVWHLAQKFENAPGLNGEFIASNSPLKRVMAVQDEDNILLNIYWDVKATRSIPIQANPSILAGRV